MFYRPAFPASALALVILFLVSARIFLFFFLFVVRGQGEVLVLFLVGFLGRVFLVLAGALAGRRLGGHLCRPPWHHFRHGCLLLHHPFVGARRRSRRLVSPALGADGLGLLEVVEFRRATVAN